MEKWITDSDQQTATHIMARAATSHKALTQMQNKDYHTCSDILIISYTLRSH
jgi:hypothetical protein